MNSAGTPTLGAHLLRPLLVEYQKEAVRMAKIEHSVEVNVPLNTAYNQWTQFETFPQFMEGVKEVRQLDDKRLRWCAEVGGKEKEWDAMIGTQVPDQMVAWHSTSGADNAGSVTFEPLGADRPRLTLQ